MIQLLRHLQTIWSTLKFISRFGRPTHILSFGHSLGDNLLLTTLARGLKKQGHCSVWIKCDHPELFQLNHDIDLVIPYNTLLSTSLLNMLGVQQAFPRYTHYRPETDADSIPEKHIILKMADAVQLKGIIENAPRLVLSENEVRKGFLNDKQIAITTSTAGALVRMSTKEWMPERYQVIVDTLQPDFQFVQIGSADDYPLKNVTDLRGKLTIRESAAIVQNALLTVTHVGFVMHLARAVNCPSVIIYGGREWPEQSGYSCFRNICIQPACSPCWLQNRCPNERDCMRMIKPSVVIEAIYAELKRPTPQIAETLTNE